jgi:Flp pilus assembly protein TadD
MDRFKRKDVTGAVSKFREAIKLAPDYAQAHYQLALVLRSLGKRQEAETHLKEAQRLAPYLKVTQR